MTDIVQFFVFDEPLDIKGYQFKLLKLLSADPEKIVSYDAIGRDIWKDKTYDDSRKQAIETHIHQIRKKIQSAFNKFSRNGEDIFDGDPILNIKDVGYRLNSAFISSERVLPPDGIVRRPEAHVDKVKATGQEFSEEFESQSDEDNHSEHARKDYVSSSGQPPEPLTFEDLWDMAIGDGSLRVKILGGSGLEGSGEKASHESTLVVSLTPDVPYRVAVDVVDYGYLLLVVHDDESQIISVLCPSKARSDSKLAATTNYIPDESSLHPGFRPRGSRHTERLVALVSSRKYSSQLVPVPEDVNVLSITEKYLIELYDALVFRGVRLGGAKLRVVENAD